MIRAGFEEKSPPRSKVQIQAKKRKVDIYIYKRRVHKLMWYGQCIITLGSGTFGGPVWRRCQEGNDGAHGN